METINEQIMWEYCKGHVGPHTTGWCGVDQERRIALNATTRKEAYEESRANGWPIYGEANSTYWNIYGELKDKR